MSRFGRIVDGAKSGLASLLGEQAAGGEPISHVDEQAFARELASRNEHKGAARPADNPRAKWAGAGDMAGKMREEAAHKREGQVRRERDRKIRAAERAREEEFQRAKRAAASSGPSYQPPPPGSSSSRPRPAGGRDPKIASYYRTLNLAEGATFDEVKSAYRKLMRRYHPDLHHQSAKKQKAATELTVQVTQAYNALEKHLKD